MTTRAMERGRPKCHQYWEPDVGAEVIYGQFLVKTEAIETDTEYTVTTISLTNNKVSIIIMTSLLNINIMFNTKIVMNFKIL